MASLTAECFVSDGDAYATLGVEPRASRQAGSQAAQASRAPGRPCSAAHTCAPRLGQACHPNLLPLPLPLPLTRRATTGLLLARLLVAFPGRNAASIRKRWAATRSP